MSFIDHAKAVATMAVPGPDTPDNPRAAFDAMPIAALAARWRMLQFVSVRQQTEETWAARLYFDRLPHQHPARAYDMVLAVLAEEPDLPVRLRLNDMMATLVHVHGAALIERIEAAAENASLRWLLGGAYWWTPDKAIEERLAAVADVDGFRADQQAHASRNPLIDLDSLSIEDLARVWVDETNKPFKDHDGNWHALRDYERTLVEQDADTAIDLVIAVLRIETNPSLLSVLAAGLLEDVIDMSVIERIEREAAADPRFLALLGGVWYSRKPDAVKARLDAILGRGILA